MNRVQRITYGPDFRGHKPIQVCIVHYRDKEEILRKARLLKGSNIYISEDFSRKGIYLNVSSYYHKYKQNIPYSYYKDKPISDQKISKEANYIILIFIQSH